MKKYISIVDPLRSLIDRWLFRSGGQYNCAIARIAIAAALWFTLIGSGNFAWIASDWPAWLAGRSGAGYTPKGIVKIADWWFGGIPPGIFYKLVFEASRIAIIFMALGLVTRLSQVIAAVGTLYCVSFETSFGPYWSHAYNVQLLAALAFMFARSGDVWSVDALIRRWRGQLPPAPGNVYWWPVIFAELATALFMFGAFFQKVRETGIYWALSDNLRNSIGITWFQYRADPPAIAEWIASDPWIYKTAGLMQLFTQSTTILACFLVAYPAFRLIFGAGFFLGEILGLGHVFRFWHPFWVPLCLLSIDFEHFWRAWKARKDKRSAPAPISFASRARRWLFQRRLEGQGRACPPPSAYKRKLIGVFGLLFFGYYLANIYWRLGEVHLNYPFSSMAFYSETRAMRPYDRARLWPIYTGRIDLFEEPLTPVKFWYREGHLEDQIFRTTSLAGLRDLERSAKSRRGLMYALHPSGKGPERRAVKPVKVVYRSGLMAVTPHPQKLDFIDLHMGLRAVEDDKGWRALIGKVAWSEAHKMYGITIEHKGFRAPRFEILARFNVREDPKHTEPKPLIGHWEGATFYVAYTGTPDFLYTLVNVKDDILGIDEVYYGPDNFQSYR